MSNFFSRQNWKSQARLVRVLAAVVLTVVLTSYLDLCTDCFAELEQQTYGDRLTVDSLRDSLSTQRAESTIRVIAIDDSTYAATSDTNSPTSSIPRRYYAALINNLTAYGAKVIVFDMLLDAATPEDKSLASAIHRSGKVVLACGDEGPPTNKIIYPLSLFKSSGCFIGHTRVPVYSDSPAIDQIAPLVFDGGKALPALSVEAVRIFRGVQDRKIDGFGSYGSISGVPIVTNSEGLFRVHYLGDDLKVFPHALFQDIAAPSSKTMESFYRQYFGGKIVIVGDTTRDHGDLRMTPLGLMPGVVIHANALATVLEENYLRDISEFDEIAVIAALALCIGLLVSKLPLMRGSFFAFLLLLTFGTVNVFIFTELNIYLHLIAPAFAILLTALFVLLERGLTEENEKTRIRSLLQRYVSPRIADHLLLHPELIGAEGKRVTGSVLFSDVSGFTALSEKLTPEELVLRMNEYFQAVMDIVFKHDGTVASIAGDAMLAVFGVPLAVNNHAQQAVLAAVEIREVVSELRLKWKRLDDSEFDVGIGINSGEMVVGEVGGKHLRNFSVYGLQVNIASRIEGLTKEIGSTILVSRATRDAIQDEFMTYGPYLKRIKGVADPIEIFELHTDGERLPKLGKEQPVAIVPSSS